MIYQPFDSWIVLLWMEGMDRELESALFDLASDFQIAIRRTPEKVATAKLEKAQSWYRSMFENITCKPGTAVAMSPDVLFTSLERAGMVWDEDSLRWLDTHWEEIISGLRKEFGHAVPANILWGEGY